MEMERWAEVSRAICEVGRQMKFRPRDTHPTSRIGRVHLRAALHDRPTTWAWRAKHWTTQNCPEHLSHQSAMSRRLGRNDFEPFLQALHTRPNGRPQQAWVEIVDRKALEPPNPTTDRDATWLGNVCRHHNHQLLCPRAKPGTGRGHHYPSPDRLRAIDLLERPAA